MNASIENPAAVQILAQLKDRLSSVDTKSAWLAIGDALADLERLGPQSADGHPWVEVVQKRYADFGYDQLSIGHLHKIRRVRNFVRKTLQDTGETFTDDEIIKAQVSALEVADRLYALDPERGRAALVACIKDRKKFVDMRREYDAYVEDNPDRLPPKRATWLKKRQSATSSLTDASLVEKVLLSDMALFLGADGAMIKSFEPVTLLPLLKATDFGFHVLSPSIRRALGITLVTDHAFERKNLAAFLAQLEFQSTFFDSYWVLARGPAAVVREFADAMTKIRLDRIGLLQLDDDGGWTVIKRPDGTLPAPDRRDLLKA